MISDKLLPSEAVIAFVAWLTTRDEATVMGASHDSAVAATLVRDWIAVNQLKAPREDFGGVDLRQPEYLR